MKRMPHLTPDARMAAELFLAHRTPSPGPAPSPDTLFHPGYGTLCTTLWHMTGERDDLAQSRSLLMSLARRLTEWLHRIMALSEEVCRVKHDLGKKTVVAAMKSFQRFTILRMKALYSFPRAPGWLCEAAAAKAQWLMEASRAALRDHRHSYAYALKEWTDTLVKHRDQQFATLWTEYLGIARRLYAKHRLPPSISSPPQDKKRKVSSPPSFKVRRDPPAPSTPQPPKKRMPGSPFSPLGESELPGTPPYIVLTGQDSPPYIVLTGQDT